MAYFDFAQGFETSIPAVASKPLAETKARLSPLEWSVVALAQKDRLSSIHQPGRVSIAMGVLFGKRPSPVLADPRLEALRRLSVIAWHRGYAIHPSEIHAFKAAGFTIEQYELVLGSISRGRNALNQRVH